MSYRITYQSKQKRNTISCLRLPILTLLCFMLFVFLAEILWPEGVAVLRDAVSSQRNVISVSALDNLAEDLYDGETWIAAICNFWDNLIS